MSQTKTLNIVPDDSLKRIHLSQGDLGRTLIFKLFEGSASYSPPTGATVKIVGTKPSGVGYSVNGTFSGNTVTIVTTSAMTDEHGAVESELIITNQTETEIFKSANFLLMIEKDPHPAGTVDGESNVVVPTLLQLQSAIGDLTQLNTTDKSSLVGAINEAMMTGGSSGLTNDIKEALLDCFEHVAWIDEDGQDYYDALHDALYPSANLTSITCVYTQSGTVYDTDTLDSLKTDLVVTAHYDDSSTAIVTTYTLSGALTEGTSTITVSYGGKSATFNVTITHATMQYSITNNLTNCTNSSNTTAVNENTSYSGTLSADSGYILTTVTVTMGGADITSTAYNSSTGAISIASVTGNVVITAEAIVDVGWVSGVPYDMTDGLTENKYLNNGVETAYNGWAISPYLPCEGAFYKSDVAFTLAYCAGYDSSDTFVQRVNARADVYENYDEYDIKSIRVSDSTSKVTSAVIIPYRLEELAENKTWESGTYYRPSNMTYGEGYISSSTGAIVSRSDHSYSDYMNCYNATKITDNLEQVYRTYAFYDGNKDFISAVDIVSSDHTLGKETTVPSGARYFRVSKGYPSQGLCFKLT